MNRVVMALGVMALVALLIVGGASAPVSAQLRQTPTPVGAECARTVTNTVALLMRDYRFQPVASPGVDFCANLEAEINAFMEAILADETDEGVPGESRLAFAFVDFGARQYVGEMPEGTPFIAVARNALPGSQMAFVISRNQDFAVFVDYTFTSITAAEFLSLPDYREWTGDIRAYCTARWCRDPGPQPTPGN
jgi:hypothetical protein